MGIEAATSTSSTSTITQASAKSSVQKTSADSFKDEMSKAQHKEVEKTENQTKNEAEKTENGTSNKETKNEDKNVTSDKSAKKTSEKSDRADTNIALNELNLVSLNGINSKLSDDIWQMMSTKVQSQGIWTVGFGEKSSSMPLEMNESDAQFFINLTQNEDVSVNTITAQAQNMLENGANTGQVQKSTQVSQALLEALTTAREKNQPVRIDFDKNVSVILRVSQNGAIAAHFIPGDKAVEQYLRNNIEMLKNTFDEKELPYTDLSYSHSSKDQNQKRRNEQYGE